MFGKVRKGTKGTDVYILQALLRGACFIGADGKAIEVDGICGNNTVYAINDYKRRLKANGVNVGAVDGVFDKACWESAGML